MTNRNTAAPKRADISSDVDQVRDLSAALLRRFRLLFSPIHANHPQSQTGKVGPAFPPP